MHEIYVICVYETSVAIFNSSTGDFLEEKGRLEKTFKYKMGVGKIWNKTNNLIVNFNGNDIYLVTHNNNQAKNTT